MSEDMHEQKLKKALVLTLISLKPEAQIKSNKEIETEISKAIGESLTRIPWLALENVTIVEE